MICRRLRCPSCGTFGYRARRRAREAADRLHVAWAAWLAAASRRCDRCPSVVIPHERGYCAHAQLVSLPPVRMMHDDVDEYAAFHRRQVEAMDSPFKGMALGLHDHTPDEPCVATCTFYPAVEYDTADVVADVIGPLSYEDQSEMFGDPIADVIRRETE